MKMNARSFLPLLAVAVLFACQKERPDPIPSVPAATAPRLIMKFKFDSTQVRLGSHGEPVSVPTGHGAQSPRFNVMSAHYVEFTPTALTPLGQGDVVYTSPTTTAGGASAIDYAQEVKVGDGGTFLDIPLSSLAPGTYEWLRVSLAYQNYDVNFRYTDPTFGQFNLTGTLASFIGVNTYIGSYQVDQQTVTVNGNRLQGYWGFEVHDPPVPLAPTTGQAPGTTVVNPLFGTSAIPAGSCVVTGGFAQPLTITGNETQDVTITVSLSTNKSFEWSDAADDNIYEPLVGDTVVDMGVRGLIPIVE
ncbi:MAG: hypothetical protein IPI95_03995 [Flavobacteriales bacterium]|jgi:hypothetical protein|nr:hypothetical protein [Flavobacteriales bacterium]